MNCQSLRNWLLQVESLQPKTWPPEAVTHLKACAHCVKFANSLAKVEKSWREQPLPANCGQAKAAFLKQLAVKARSAPVKLPIRRFRPARWAAVAAMVLLPVGLLTWVLSPSESRASEVVDRLVELNTDLAHADYAKRKQLLETKEDTLRKRLQSERLSAEERASGEDLLKAAHKLATSDDLEEDEEIVNKVAEVLLDRAKIAHAKGTDKESEHCNLRYTKFVESAVKPLHIRLRMIDRLIGFNTQLASADAKKRKQLYDDNVESLQQDLQDAKLPPEEHAMAEKLLELARRMATNNDLGSQAQAITDAADKLRKRAEDAEKKDKKKESDRCAIGYSMFVEKAMNPFFDNLKSPPKGAPDPKKLGFDFSKFQKQFELNRQRGSDFRRPEMDRRFESQTKKGFGLPPFIKFGKR